MPVLILLELFFIVNVMVKVLLSFGSNLGDRVGQIQESIQYLQHHPQIENMRVSSYYETEPLYYKEQPWFINCVAELYTSLTAYQLLDCCQLLEKLFKKDTLIPNGPRTLDIDILMYGDQTLVSERLHVPHPRMFERNFVMVPLLELATNCNVMKQIQKSAFPTCFGGINLYPDLKYAVDYKVPTHYIASTVA